MPLARAGRITADLCVQMPLPGGTDTISLPKISAGVTTAAQTEAAAASNTDLTTTSVSGAVITIAGQQIVSMQLLDQSPINFDEVIFADLLAALATNVDTQVLNGSGSAPNVRGVRNVASINAITYTDSTATAPELYPKLIKAQGDIAANRYLPAQAYVMHPRRWAWLLAQLDTNNRPFIVANPQGPQNAFAGLDNVRAEGSVGNLGGLPVYIDPNILTNLGAGTDQDTILACRFDDLYLFEGPLRTRTLFETDANTLQVRFQLWEYMTFIGGRYPASISAIDGTGLNAVLS